MELDELMSDILNSWHKPVVFVDMDHVIRYMNRPALKQFAKWGDILGKSIFACHKETSRTTICGVFDRLKKGEEEVLITSNGKHRVYMRRVCNETGQMIGYFERYDPAVGD